jgi:signal transduction histidine kinase
MNGKALSGDFASAMMALPKRWALLAALALILLTAWFDHAIGMDVTVEMLYGLPVVLTVWKAGLRLGLACTFLCTAAWGAARYGLEAYHTGWVFALALTRVWTYFAILAIAVAAVKSRFELGTERIELLERAQRLERQIIAESEYERERIGRELHDGLCQNLAGIAALSATLSRSLAAKFDTDASAAAAEISKLLNAAIGEARNLARGLRPMGLQGVDLAAALENMALNVAHQFCISCTFNHTCPLSEFHHQAEAQLFRIAQEAINNAVTHGRANRIEISLSCTDGEGLLRVQDNGVGIPDEPERRSGSGLGTMAHRAHLLGGSIEVRGSTPHGTAVRCVFPLFTTAFAPERSDHG